MNSQSLARGLAFFSVGLGLAELLAPRTVARTIGVDEDNDTLLRLLGLREIGSGVGIMQGYPAGFVWGRVAGDAMDLGLLAMALRNPKSNRNRVIGAMTAVAGVTALDVVGAMMLSRNPAEPEWRVAREDRSGMQFDDPVAMRQRSEELMDTHQSGHWRHHSNGGMPQTGMTERENEAASEFGPGD